MVRKTALVTAMLGAFASQAYAMGLGDIRLISVLNQPLHAEIELLSPTANDLAELQVGLASGDAYAKAGVERVFFHTKLRFSVVKRADGTAAIKVTSHDPVREPYLDFLIEATWGSGQVLREYTVLVDPPALMPAPRPAVTAPVTSMPSATRAPSTSVATETETATETDRGSIEDTYQTRPSDTLWSIANAVRPDASVSTEQAMLGLLKANPEAFINGNINNLKAGRILQVPGADAMTALSHSDALTEVRRQNSEWRGTRAVAAPPVSEPAQQAAAPAATTPQPEASAPTEAQLKLLAPQTEAAKGSAGGAQGDGDLRQELTLAVEAVEAQRQENQELNARLKQLEDQISQLHRLIELKNTEMAQLGGTAAPDTATTAPAPAPEATAAPETTTPPATDTPAADAAAGAPESAPPAAEAAPPAQSEAQTPAGVPATPSPTVPPATSAAPPTSAASVEQHGGLIAWLANPLVTWGAVGVAALVALLAWMTARRRRMQDTDFQESILADRKSKATSAAAATASAAAAVSAARASEVQADQHARDTVQSDSSLFTDFAVSDMGALQNDAEADPVAEADVYLAYGRYQQAEELIRTALSRAPQRNDLKFKLLEVLYAAKNVSAFDAEAEGLLASLGSEDDELWQRAKEMGQELNPGNPLYRSGAAAATGAVGTVAAADHGLDFDLGGGNAVAAPATAADDNTLDFDVSDLASFTMAKEGSAASSIPVDEDFNFGLDAGADDDGMLASSDEVATKLDLARAYIEMGDPEGARSILDEVMQEGSAAQKSEAQSLLAQTG